MNARRERTEAEKKAMQGQRQRFSAADLADLPPEYAAQFRSQMDPNYISFAAQEGDYKVVPDHGQSGFYDDGDHPAGHLFAEVRPGAPPSAPDMGKRPLKARTGYGSERTHSPYYSL